MAVDTDALRSEAAGLSADTGSSLNISAEMRLAIRSVGLIFAGHSLRISTAERLTVYKVFPRTRFRPDTRLDLGGRDVESHGGRYGRGAQEEIQRAEQRAVGEREVRWSVRRKEGS